MRMHSFLADQKPVMFSCTLLLLLLLLSLARMMASIGSSCSPTVYTKFITKSDSLFFLFFLQSGLYIEPQLFYYKVRAEKLRQA